MILETTAASLPFTLLAYKRMINSNDFIEFEVGFAAAGTYNVKLRVASAEQVANVNFLSDSNPFGSITFGGTGGWRTWVTLEGELTLDAAPPRLTLALNNPSETNTNSLMNINWFSFTQTPQDDPLLLVSPTRSGKTVAITL